MVKFPMRLVIKRVWQPAKHASQILNVGALQKIRYQNTPVFKLLRLNTPSLPSQKLWKTYRSGPHVPSLCHIDPIRSDSTERDAAQPVSRFSVTKDFGAGSLVWHSQLDEVNRVGARWTKDPTGSLVGPIQNVQSWLVVVECSWSARQPSRPDVTQFLLSASQNIAPNHMRAWKLGPFLSSNFTLG